jgi:hypothetical protein
VFCQFSTINHSLMWEWGKNTHSKMSWGIDKSLIDSALFFCQHRIQLGLFRREQQSVEKDGENLDIIWWDDKESILALIVWTNLPIPHPNQNLKLLCVHHSYRTHFFVHIQTKHGTVYWLMIEPESNNLIEFNFVKGLFTQQTKCE